MYGEGNDHLRAVVTCAVALRPGESANHSIGFNVGTATTGQPLLVSVAADPANLIAETDETNNTYVGTHCTPAP